MGIGKCGWLRVENSCDCAKAVHINQAPHQTRFTMRPEEPFSFGKYKFNFDRQNLDGRHKGTRKHLIFIVYLLVGEISDENKLVGLKMSPYVQLIKQLLKIKNAWITLFNKVYY
jgi:hypothetical protein